MPRLTMAKTGVPAGTSKCVYFANREVLTDLEKLLDKYPRASFSSIVAQFVKPLTEALASAPPGQRQLEFKVRVWV
jgi:hypothetical protein